MSKSDDEILNKLNRDREERRVRTQAETNPMPASALSVATIAVKQSAMAKWGIVVVVVLGAIQMGWALALMQIHRDDMRAIEARLNAKTEDRITYSQAMVLYHQVLEHIEKRHSGGGDAFGY